MHGAAKPTSVKDRFTIISLETHLGILSWLDSEGLSSIRADPTVARPRAHIDPACHWNLAILQGGRMETALMLLQTAQAAAISR